MTRSVLDRPPHIHAQGYPRERLLEDALTEVASEEKRIGPMLAEPREEPEMGHAEILRLINHGEVKCWMSAFRNGCRQLREHRCPRDHVPRREVRSDLLEQRPKDGALSLWKSCFSAEAHDISIHLPGIHLPRINDLLPLG